VVNETIERIQASIDANESMNAEKKQELLTLISKLRNEVSTLEETHGDAARSVAGFAEASVHEATRREVNRELLRHSLDGMSLSVRRFEVSHPRLVGVINNIGQTLWRMGI
jgi:Mg2+ and Co2+ transporter CorA